ncbi:MAG TPA: hypothetical protein PLP30_01390 [Clostridia bacterium]|nr:hypothetical protein [Clostridia bacterium]
MIVLRAADNKTFAIAVSGILGALCIALLYLMTLSPVMDLSIYFIISLFPAIVLIETDHGRAWLFFAATSLLSLILPVGKLQMLYYYTFFGFYGIIKFYCERYMNKVIGIISRTALFVLSLSFNYLVAGAFLPAGVYERFTLPILLLIAIPVFFIYDYIYTLVINYYENNIRKKLRR